MASPTPPSSSRTVIQWALDTRPLWPSASETRHLPDAAPRAFALLTPDQRAVVLRFHFVRDAKLALGSVLLKRLAIARHCRVPWPAAVPARDARTKPVFRMPGAAAAAQPLRFNVSHQAGLVVLFAVRDPDDAPAGRPEVAPPGDDGDGADADDAFAIGVDVVCPSERRERDHRMIADEGWPRFVSVHDEVFSPGEAARLCTLAPSPATATATTETHPDGGWDGPLVHFYALWCLREAYVKMTGEALLASWLRELDLRGVAPPPRGEPHRTARRGALELWFRGRRVEGVDMRMSWLLDEYMVCTAVRKGRDGKGAEVGEFEVLNIDHVLAAAEAAS